MSDTPRTDAVCERYAYDNFVAALDGTEAFARELERENNQLRAMCKRLLDAHEHINCTTMSHVVSPEHGFERCKTIARTAIAEYREAIDKARSATP